MSFKKNWERSSELVEVSASAIEGMVQQAIPDNKLLSYELISEGCSNLNVKIQINEPESPSFILRIYFANQEGPFMERLSHRLLKDRLPLPEIHYIGDYENYRFAIAQYMRGRLLRDFLLEHKNQSEIETMMFAVGVLLARIASFQFSQSGTFNRDLVFTGGCSHDGYLHFINLILKKENIVSHFNHAILSNIKQFTEKNKFFFPHGTEKNFVHGDFDPNNILVDQIEGVWKVTAVLDWETPFAGNPFCDISNMLRYRRQMLPAFESSFLEGLRSEGMIIPEDWSCRVDLLNVVALLSCLAKTNSEKSPRQCEDICRLVEQIVEL
ncbi:MAG: aminoglycoside phosphotransferase family protein [Verrucomicrobia bacterium]|nr:aminoglycoside phosphotransferase family protein [Verrucomicrobiota bacterium]